MQRKTPTQIIRELNEYVSNPDRTEILTDLLSDHRSRMLIKNIAKFREIPEDSLISAISSDLPEDVKTEIKTFFANYLYLDAFEDYASKPEPTTEVNELRAMKWYRGVSHYPLHDVTTGRSDSAVFVTNDILQAATYAGEDGFIAELSLDTDFFTRRHQPSFGADFSPLTYHDEVLAVRHKRELVIARNVRDSGQFIDFDGLGNEEAKKHYGTAINLGLNSNNKILKLESLRPAKEVVIEHLKALSPTIESKIELKPKASKMKI